MRPCPPPAATRPRACGLILLFLLLLIGSAVVAQPGPAAGAPRAASPASALGARTFIAPEICGNGTDDNGNGLVDIKDYQCYYAPSNTTCAESKVIWVCTQNSLFWIDMETGAEHLVANNVAADLYDLAWGADGKLYAIDMWAKLLQIDPETGTVTPLPTPFTYWSACGLTADDRGNLYIATRSTGGGEDLVRYNLATGAFTVMMNLASLGLSASGDICFFEGHIYISCLNNYILRINPNTGSTVRFLTNANTFSAYGITTIGDGFLYMNTGMEMVRLDPATMQQVAVVHSYTLVSSVPTGFASYVEQCNARACKATVQVSNLSTPPFCAATGVQLAAQGSGINGPAQYTWKLPGGGTNVGAMITATVTGRYYARYHELPDSCGSTDSIDIVVIPAPAPRLTEDTILCAGTSFSLPVLNPQPGEQYVWQDGGAGPVALVAAPGRYTVTATNVCGSGKDSVLVTEGMQPSVDLGADREKCFFDSVVLRTRIEDAGFRYRWSNGASTPFTVADSAGLYWLEVTTACGVKRDTVLVLDKATGCERALWVPNAFTPNRDGRNDRFGPVLYGTPVLYEFRIFNRWGEQLFESFVPGSSWDGSFRGREQPDDVYVWTCSFQIRGLKAEVRKGTMLLIR